MIRLTSGFATAAIASLLLIGAASAQTPAQTTAPAAAPMGTTKMPAAKAEKPHTAASLECSKQADAKGLHGTERRKFRADCKKTAKTN